MKLWIYVPNITSHLSVCNLFPPCRQVPEVPEDFRVPATQIQLPHVLLYKGARTHEEFYDVMRRHCCGVKLLVKDRCCVINRAPNWGQQ